MGAKASQNIKVLEHMKKYGTIDPRTAIERYGIMRLASRISDLKRAGYKIKSERVYGPNREGERTHWSVYSLGGK